MEFLDCSAHVVTTAMKTKVILMRLKTMIKNNPNSINDKEVNKGPSEHYELIDITRLQSNAENNKFSQEGVETFKDVKKEVRNYAAFSENSKEDISTNTNPSLKNLAKLCKFQTRIFYTVCYAVRYKKSRKFDKCENEKQSKKNL